MLLSLNFPKVCGPRNQVWLRFCLTLIKMSLSVNFPKVCGSRNQAWLRFYLSFIKTINEHMTKEIFINNNTFSGYLHSKGVVLHVHLGLQENMLLYQPPRWYDMTPPNWATAFPMLDSLQYLEPFSIQSHQALTVSASHWHYN